MHPLRKLILDHVERAVAMAIASDPQAFRGRNDASESAFLARQLEHIRASIFEVRYPELKGRRLVPVLTQVHAGAEDFTYRWFDEVAQAVIVKTYGRNAPRADVLAQEATSKIRGILAAYGWTLQEMRAAMLANVSLDARKAKAARNAIERRIDDLLLIGDAEVAAEGLFTLTGTIVTTAAIGGLGSATWALKTSEEILDDLFGSEEKIYVDSNEIESPDTMVLPVAQEALISRKRIGDGDSQTIKQYFLKNAKHVKNIETSIKLTGRGAGSTDRMVTYRRDPDKLEGIIPVDFEQLPPQWEGYESVTYCHGRCGGAVVYFPKSVHYKDGI